MSKSLEEAIRAALADGKLACAAAFQIAKELKVTPQQVGQTADDFGIRISRCQMGLFGYGDKRLGQHRIVTPLRPVPPALEAALREAAPSGRLACTDAWGIAERLGVPRLTVSGAAEALGIKVVSCQLGCF